MLRAAVGGIAITLGTLYISGQSDRAALVWLAGCLLIAGGVALAIGLGTPLASLLVAVCIVAMDLSWFPSPPVALFGGGLMPLLLATTAVGIFLLGPGAFSLDGYLFGRREIVIPPRTRES